MEGYAPTQEERRIQDELWLSDWMRSCGKSEQLAFEGWVAAGNPTREFVPVPFSSPEPSETLNTFQRRVLVLSERINDAGIRSILVDLNGGYVVWGRAQNMMEGIAAQTRMGDGFRKANETIGELLRELPM